MKKIFALTALLLAFAISAGAQIVTHTPAILQESSQNVVLTYHADAPEGNNGLKGVTASDPVYAHIGVITDKSNNSWVYGPAKWGDNAAKYKLDYVSANTWTLNLGNMREYFGITDATEHIQRIAIVFRNGGCTKEGKTASGGDIFVDVEPEGYQMRLSSSPSATLVSQPTQMTFTVDVTAPSQITLYVNDTQIKSESSATRLTASYNIAAQGSYAVRATATSAQGSIERTLNIAYPGSSEAGTYPGGVPRMGTVRNADGTVTFCLAAPGKSSVVLVPSWDSYQVLGKNTMKYQDYNGQRYFWTTVSGLDNSTWYPYYYIVDGKYKVGDPYARLILDPYSDKWLDEGIWPDMPKYPYDRFDDVVLAVYKGDFDNYSFSDFKIPDHRNLIIYELLIRDFTGTEGQANGEGTLRKALEKLPYLADLGVNVIELMPVMEFNGNNSWGYNTNFYFALDKAYGSPDDMRDFVEQAHRHGIAVVLDIALNHSDGLHPWYQMYDISNNPFYNASAPHAYSVLNDWKQENTLVQQQWKDVLQFWMKSYNVDGYRFDLVKGLGTSYNNGDTEGFNQSRIDVMKRLHSHLTEVKPDAIHINEHLAGMQEENAMAADGQLNWNNQNYNSRNYGSGQTSNNNLLYYDDEKCSRTRHSLISYAESHDEERMAYTARNNGVSAIKSNEKAMCNRLGQVAVQLLLSAGSKMIWQFGELAADQTTKNQDGSNNTDPKLVIWDNLNNPNIKALHDTYKDLCHFRKDNPDLFTNGTVTYTGFANGINSNRIIRWTNGDRELMAFIRCTVSGTSSLMVGGTSTVLSPSNSQLIASSADFSQSLQGSGTSVRVQLKPNEYAVFATLNTAGVDDITADGSHSVTVSGGNGEITISGDYNTVRVYDLQGTSYPTLTVAPGLYIVTVDGHATKVMVK
ncbi:MAG: alpha-amylase family glycosyl hydrolase [Muribaculaceae bacterium]